MQQELIFAPSCSLQTGCWGTNDPHEEDRFLFFPLVQLNFIKRMNTDLGGYSDIQQPSLLFIPLMCYSFIFSLES